MHVQNCVVATCCDPWLSVSKLDVVDGEKVVFTFVNGGLLECFGDGFDLHGAVLGTCCEQVWRLFIESDAGDYLVVYFHHYLFLNALVI